MANLVRWEPFPEFVTLREAMNRLFQDSFVRPGEGTELTQLSAGRLAVDMYETDQAVVVKSALPGVKPEDVDISLVGDVLTIKGEVSSEDEAKEESYIRRERRTSSFYRSVSVPVPVVAEKGKAEFENGELTLTLPKAEEVKPKSIKVVAKSK